MEISKYIIYVQNLINLTKLFIIELKPFYSIKVDYILFSLSITGERSSP